MDKPVIYTVGHSSHPATLFLDLLNAHAVTCLVDVRSVAASSYNPQYNKEPLSKFLKANNIIYLHFDKAFGARHTDPDLLDEDGKVNFELVRKSQLFKSGIERLWQGIYKGYKIALMCSEAEPMECHRFSMISIALAQEGFDVMHILKDKTLKTNAQMEAELLKKFDKKIPKPDMFQPDITQDNQLKTAYRLLNKEIAFSPISKQLQEENYD